MEQTSLVKRRGIKKSVELFKNYHCKNCGSANVDVFVSNASLCLKCDDCNERVIFSKEERKQGVVEGEIKGYKNVIFCLEKENKRFKERINPYINNSELEQFTREQIQEIKRFIIEVKEED